jgi:hypothetical protein
MSNTVWLQDGNSEVRKLAAPARIPGNGACAESAGPVARNSVVSMNSIRALKRDIPAPTGARHTRVPSKGTSNELYNRETQSYHREPAAIARGQRYRCTRTADYCG